MRGIAVASVLAATVAAPALARAQTTPPAGAFPYEANVDLRTIRSSLCPWNFLTGQGAYVDGPVRPSGGFWCNYGNSPFVLYDVMCPAGTENVDAPEGCTVTGARARPL